MPDTNSERPARTFTNMTIPPITAADIVIPDPNKWDKGRIGTPRTGTSYGKHSNN